jgi:hypothetical protein
MKQRKNKKRPDKDRLKAWRKQAHRNWKFKQQKLKEIEE